MLHTKSQSMCLAKFNKQQRIAKSVTMVVAQLCASLAAIAEGVRGTSMEHKAYEFDWNSFEKEFAELFISSLRSDDKDALIAFIESNPSSITDPYEGNSLEDNWKEYLNTLSTLEIADHALTKYYSVEEEFGLCDEWLPINETLCQKEIDALLGISYSEFDPGCYGSYFQSPLLLVENIGILSNSGNKTIRSYLGSLSNVCKGLYVTF